MPGLKKFPFRTKKLAPHSRRLNLSIGYKFKGATCILPYKFQELKESLYFVELYYKDANSFPRPWKMYCPWFPPGLRFKARPKKYFRDTGARKEKRGMKIRIKKLIGNRSPLMGIVLSVILSLSWGLVITLFWGK